jgi:8-oxo-dGTP pyrophosphatase MutT (NUDIX family)
VAILIDPPHPEAHGRRWSHLVSDDNVEELHAFAQGLGIPARAFEGDHYDVPEERYADVVAAGARPVPPRELLRSLTASGLRMQKRRGDTGVARATGIRFVDGSIADVDLIRSPREADARRVFAAMVFVRDAVGDHAVVRSVRRDQWGAPGGWRVPPETVRENAVREAREECGLELDPAALRAVGYERFHHHRPGGPLAAGLDLLQVYAVDLPVVRPALTSSLDDTDDRRWVTWDELEALCGDHFYWPLVEAALSPRAG